MKEAHQAEKGAWWAERRGVGKRGYAITFVFLIAFCRRL